MKVMMINGSPHQDGCTNRALSEMKSVFEQNNIKAEIYWLGRRAIPGCQGCWSCGKLGKCVVDDIVNELHEKAKKADGFVFGSPVHYASISGTMKCFMDRLFTVDLCGNKGENLRLKPVCAVTAARRAGNTASLDEMNRFFEESQMLIVSSTYWNMVFGQNKEEVEQDFEGLHTMRTLALNMSYVLKGLDIANTAGLKKPVLEPEVSTNFIR